MYTNFNEELRDKIKECIEKDSEYRKYYECNKLFHEIIYGILQPQDGNIIETIVNTLYSYNQMLETVMTTVAANASEETVQSLIGEFSELIFNDNK